MKFNELKRLLLKNGCRLEREGANHEIWVSPQGKYFQVGRHGSEEVKAGILNAILKQAGIKRRDI